MMLRTNPVQKQVMIRSFIKLWWMIRLTTRNMRNGKSILPRPISMILKNKWQLFVKHIQYIKKANRVLKRSKRLLFLLLKNRLVQKKNLCLIFKKRFRNYRNSLRKNTTIWMLQRKMRLQYKSVLLMVKNG